MSDTNNICEQCGGVKTVYIKTTIIYEGQPEPPLEVSSGTFKLCTCPILLRKKHDGKLDEAGRFEAYIIDHGFLDGLHLLHNTTKCCFYLPPAQALSLLAWLKQEEQTLQKLKVEEHHA